MSVDSSVVVLPGLRNLRDVGGHPAADGATVARGRVYRSEVLAHPGAQEMCGVFDEAQMRAYAALGLRTVVDLRTGREEEITPSAWAKATGADVVLVPVAEGGDGARTNIMQMALSGELGPITVDVLADFYVQMLERRAGDFGSALRLLADVERLPALVHCSAGKDRTGTLVALLLSVLGTPRARILEDYAYTQVARPDRVLHYADVVAGAGLRLDDVRLLFESPPAVMAAALTHLDDGYGGAVGYLTGPGGLTDDDLSRIRENLLTRG
jgi:protein-tyrosine phosphatase